MYIKYTWKLMSCPARRGPKIAPAGLNLWKDTWIHESTRLVRNCRGRRRADPRLARGLTSSAKDPADDLPLAQLRLCGILSEGPRPMSALSRALGVSLSALTQIADRLERARLVKRVAEGNDRRVRCLQLTARGEKMMRKRREARVLRTLAVLEHLSAPQREAVRASLEILVDACSAVQAGTTANGPAERRRPPDQNGQWPRKQPSSRNLSQQRLPIESNPMRTILSIVILLGLAGAGAYYYLKYYHTEGTSNFRTAQVERGNMLPTIEATGTVEPEQVVDIGSQVNGLITELKVDYGSTVEKDTVLATIDETMYQATVDQNEAAAQHAPRRTWGR